MSENDKVYSLYKIQCKNAYTGVSEKEACVINGEQGIFKSPLRIGSKDHIVEEICYRLATKLGIDCALARVRKTDKGIGVFSRFEMQQGSRFVYASTVYQATELHAEQFLSNTQNIFGNSAILCSEIQMLIFDFITGQLDRHLMNLAFIKDNTGIIKPYKLYDNGIALYSINSNESAINCLSSAYYSGRMGDSNEIYESINNYSNALGYPVHKIVGTYKIGYTELIDIVNKSDRYKEIIEARKEAMARFMEKQIGFIRELG